MTCPNFLFHLQPPSCLGTLSPVSSPSSFFFCLFCWSVYDQTLRSPAPLHCMNILIKIISHDMHTTRILVYLLCRIQTNKCDFGTTNKSCLHLKKKNITAGQNHVSNFQKASDVLWLRIRACGSDLLWYYIYQPQHSYRCIYQSWPWAPFDCLEDIKYWKGSSFLKLH